jgi:hypothetical protein
LDAVVRGRDLPVAVKLEVGPLDAPVRLLGGEREVASVEDLAEDHTGHEIHAGRQSLDAGLGVELGAVPAERLSHRVGVDRHLREPPHLPGRGQVDTGQLPLVRDHRPLQHHRENVR